MSIPSELMAHLAETKHVPTQPQNYFQSKERLLPGPGNECDTGIWRPGEDINHDDDKSDLCQPPLVGDGFLLDQGGFSHMTAQTLNLPVAGAV